jgi:hypothetical protein
MRTTWCWLAVVSLLACLSVPLPAQTAPAAGPGDTTWQRLRFLLGTWQAKTGSVGTAKAEVDGSYTFREDLDGHAITRRTSADTCKSESAFDCQHNDSLVIFRDETHPKLGDVFALYLDNEGHAIHYVVSTPDAHTAIFQSETSVDHAPSFRLVDHLQGSGLGTTMTGKFQMAAPGTTDYHSFVEWSGRKK